MMMSKRAIAAFLLLLFLATGCASQRLPLQPLIEPEPLMAAAPADSVLPPRSVKRSAAVRVAGMVPSARRVRLHLFPDVVFDAVTERLERDPQLPNVMRWHARIENAKVFGAAMLAVSPEGAFGTIHVDNRVFAVRPRQGGGTAVHEVDQDAFPQESEPRIPVRPLMTPPSPPAAPAAEPRLKVLIVLPVSQQGSICGSPILQRMLVQAANANLDRVWGNHTGSGKYAADTSIYCTTYVPKGGNLQDDLAWVQADPSVAGARTHAGANLVSLWQGDDKTSCGLGYTNYPTEAWMAPYAFNVVAQPCALEGYSFAHELGHNLGMRHDRYSVTGGGDPDACNYGFTVLDGTKPVARTVMAYYYYCKTLGLTCPRIPTYSTDAAAATTLGIPCSVKKTGVEGSANNAAQFLAGAPVAAGWH